MTITGGLAVVLLVRYAAQIVAEARALPGRIVSIPGKWRRFRARRPRARLEDAVLRRSRDIDKSVPVEIRRAGSAKVVRFSLGGEVRFYDDIRSYHRDVENNVADPRVDGFGRPPKPLSLWSIDELEEWLRAN